MLTTRYKRHLNRVLDPLATLVARTGISPLAITVATPCLGAGICLWFVRTGAVVPFCILILLVGALDGLDGAVARVSRRVTKFGAYLDAVCDRYFDAMVVVAAAVVTGYWLLSSIVLVGTLLVSYAKARAAMEVSVSNLEWPDVMERTERGLIFIGGLAASDLVSWRPLGRDLFWWTLLILALLVHLTVLQRVLRAQRFIRSRA